jgi:hypothetical protein
MMELHPYHSNGGWVILVVGLLATTVIRERERTIPIMAPVLTGLVDTSLVSITAYRNKLQYLPSCRFHCRPIQPASRLTSRKHTTPTKNVLAELD